MRKILIAGLVTAALFAGVAAPLAPAPAYARGSTYDPDGMGNDPPPTPIRQSCTPLEMWFGFCRPA